MSVDEGADKGADEGTDEGTDEGDDGLSLCGADAKLTGIDIQGVEDRRCGQCYQSKYMYDLKVIMVKSYLIKGR